MNKWGFLERCMDSKHWGAPHHQNQHCFELLARIWMCNSPILFTLASKSVPYRATSQLETSWLVSVKSWWLQALRCGSRPCCCLDSLSIFFHSPFVIIHPKCEKTTSFDMFWPISTFPRLSGGLLRQRSFARFVDQKPKTSNRSSGAFWVVNGGNGGSNG